MIEVICIFCLGICIGSVGTVIYNTKKTEQFWHEATLGMTDFDIKCMNYEYARRKLKGDKMTNGEKYAGESHNHYVFERMCPKCDCTVCGREPSDFRECRIKDKRDYERWLSQEADSECRRLSVRLPVTLL